MLATRWQPQPAERPVRDASWRPREVECLWMEQPQKSGHTPLVFQEEMVSMESETCKARMRMEAVDESSPQTKTTHMPSNVFSFEETLAALEAGVLSNPSLQECVSILHICRKERNLEQTLRLLTCMRRRGLESHNLLGNHLVSILVDVGCVQHAQHVFDKLEYRNVISWTSLMMGYIKSGEPVHALLLYQNMQEDVDTHPNGYTYLAALKACTILEDLDKGIEIHVEISRQGLLEKDLFLGNTLVDMYAKIGRLVKMQEVFDNLHVKDVVSWNALIMGYNEHGHGEKSLWCFEQMQIQGVSPNVVTYVCSLRACGDIGAVEKGQQMHLEIAKKGINDGEVLVGHALVDLYAKCGWLARAQDVFNRLSEQDVISWTTLISGYAAHGLPKEALNCLKQMQYKGVSPDSVTFLCILKACGSIGAIDSCQEVHGEIAKKGLSEQDPHVGNALVDMYANCGLLVDAKDVFNKLIVRDIVSWNALIAGYLEHGYKEDDLLNCIQQMQREGFSPTAITFACGLNACANMGAVERCQELHAQIVKIGFLESDLPVGNALVGACAKLSLIAEAMKVFETLPARDVVSWNALIGGYVESGHNEEAFSSFRQMRIQGVSPDAITFACTLRACGNMRAMNMGSELHAEIDKRGMLESGSLEEDLMEKALFDMYVNCGALIKAQQVFEEFAVRDVVLWTTLITGYAQLGESDLAFHYVDRMLEEGIRPNLVTCLSLVSICCHAGLVDKGEMMFQCMVEDYNIFPSLELLTCMVDLVSRAGQLDKALSIIMVMPFSADLAVWHIMLGACQKWRNIEVGRCAFAHAVQLDKMSSIAYTCMWNTLILESWHAGDSQPYGTQAWWYSDRSS